MAPLNINVNNTKIQTGFGPIPDGWYWLELKKVSEQVGKKNPDNVFVVYECEIKAALDQNNAIHVGKKYFDRIMVREDFNGRHMELAAACCGSKQQLNEAMMQVGGMYEPALLVGKHYLAKIVINGDFNNVQSRVVANNQNWAALAAGSDPEAIPDVATTQQPAQQAQQVQQPAPAAQPLPAQPVQQQFQAPPTQGFTPPPQQGFAPPAQPAQQPLPAPQLGQQPAYSQPVAAPANVGPALPPQNVPQG